MENFTIPPPPPQILSVVLSPLNEVVTLTRPIGPDYWLARVGQTSLLSNVGLDGLPPFAHSDWVFLLDFSSLN
jgi:hypothetical protein